MPPVMEQQPILVPTLGTREIVEISGSPVTTAMDIVPIRGAAMQETDGQPGTGLIGLLERVLDGMGVRYRRESEEVFFTISASDSGDLSVWFVVAGDERNILRIICTDHRKIPRRHWPRAFARCNSFHAQFRFGRVYLECAEGQSEGVLRFDAQLIMPEGVSGDLLQYFIYANLSCAHHFFGEGDTGGYTGSSQSSPSRKRLPANGMNRTDSKPGFVRD